MKLFEQEILKSYGITPLPMNPKEAMAYVPFQSIDPELYNVYKGFEAGTMYPTLDKPFYGKDCEAKKR